MYFDRFLYITKQFNHNKFEVMVCDNVGIKSLSILSKIHSSRIDFLKYQYIINNVIDTMRNTLL